MPTSPIIVEDGSNVTGANSYASGDVVRAYAVPAGITLPADDTALLPLITHAMLYLETFERQFKGRCTYNGQELSWPRRHVDFRGAWLDSASIPQRVIDAECQLVMEVSNGVILLPTSLPQAQGGGFLTSRKVDVLTRTFSERIGITTSPVIESVNALLAPLLTNRSMAGGLEVVRA
jgi:hypothetical protein